MTGVQTCALRSVNKGRDWIGLNLKSESIYYYFLLTYIDKSLLAGSTTTLILKLLEEKDMYGYQMIETLAQKSDDTFNLKAGTLCEYATCLARGIFIWLLD